MKPAIVQSEQSLPHRAASAEATAAADRSAPLSSGVTWILRSCPRPDSSAFKTVISKVPFRIGRACENELSLANPTVSSRHAELFFVEQDLFVKDLTSTNGTFVNGQRIEQFQGLRHGDLLQLGTEKFTVLQTGDTAIKMSTMAADVAADAMGHIQFDRLLGEPSVRPFFQPIVRLADCQRVGFEVLARSRLAGLDTPARMFRVAVERGMESDLSRLMRTEGVKAARQLGTATQLYLNTHPSELEDSTLLGSLEQLRQEAPEASMILEIHEAAVTSTSFLVHLRELLWNLNIGLAYDDFGAGQARLLELVNVPPDVIKFDMCLVGGLGEASKERRQTVRSLVRIVRKLGVTPLAEGVETQADAAACLDVGFELAQGYWFGRPALADAWM